MRWFMVVPARHDPMVMMMMRPGSSTHSTLLYVHFAMAERLCCPSRTNVIIHPSTATIPPSSTSHARHPCLALTYCAPHVAQLYCSPLCTERWLAYLSHPLLLSIIQLLIQESQLTELELLWNQLLSNSWLPKTNTRANFFCREVTSKM